MQEPWGRWGPGERFQLRRPDGGSFSPTAFFYSVWGRASSEWPRRTQCLFLVDPADRTAWRLDFEELRGVSKEQSIVSPRLRLQPLPGESRIEGSGLVRQAGQEEWTTGIVCEDSGYVWDGASWLATPDVHRPENPFTVQVDALAPVISGPELEGGSTPRKWTLAPHGVREWSAAGLLAAPALLRPLPSALWTVLSPDRGRGRHWSKDLVLGDYPWLLVLPLLGTALTVLWIRRRLRRLGAEPARLRPWLLSAVRDRPRDAAALPPDRNEACAPAPTTRTQVRASHRRP